ncbi:MAG: DUF5677 domain-containing protein [Patescibacteria group bacterium]
MEQKLKGILEKTLKVTEPLAGASSPSNANFVNVLLGIYRVSFGTLRDIYYLSNNDDTGSSCLDLTRKIIEYGISVEYMLWKGKDKMAVQFQNHLFKEIHDEIEFLKSIGQNPADQNDDLNLDVEDAEKNYNTLSPDAKSRHSWAGISVDKMVEILHEAGHLKDFDSSRIGQAYIWGCRLNHVSPMIVKSYMSKEEADVASNFYLRQALMIATIFHIRLTTRYIDEIRLITGINSYQDIADNLNLLEVEMTNL